MGITLTEQQELESQYVQGTYKRKPLCLVRGDGMRLYDDEGREYLDFIAGIGAVSVGHCNTRVTEAIQTQAAKLGHVSNYYYVEGRGQLAKKLSKLLNDDVVERTSSAWKTFFTNSGTESVEGAIKIARKYGNKHLQGADTIISARRSFHGRSLAALTATGQPSKQESFQPLPEGFKHVELNDIAALKQALHQSVGGMNVAAVLLECIQGEGGVYPCTTEYLEAARELTAERGILLMIDEVQTGFYRTGTHPFAYQHHGILPDVVCLAKGIGNGMPMGAVCAHGAAAAAFEPGDHGSTFGGSPLAIAAANATLDELAQMQAGEHVRRVGEHLLKRLVPLVEPCGIKSIRGSGLMVGVEFKAPIAEAIVDTALEQGLLLNSIGHHILRILPPLVCTEADIDVLVDAVKSIAGKILDATDREQK